MNAEISMTKTDGAVAPRRPPERATRKDRDVGERRDALARHHAEMTETADQIDRLLARLEATGVDAFARALAAAIVTRFDRFAADGFDREERRLFAPLARDADGEVLQSLDRLHMDHAWIAANWLELRPLLDNLASGLLWVDVDALRDAAELFAALLREHVGLESSVFARTAIAAQGIDAAA